MTKRIGLILIILITSLSVISCKDSKYDKYRVYPVPDKLEIPAGEKSFIALKIEIPENSHIYGNPKGPGTGKATRVTAAGDSDLIFSPPAYLPPEKYTAPGEKEYVWSYKDETKIFIPLEARKSAKTGRKKIKIEFESLLCDISTCIPENRSFDYEVKILPPGSTGSTHTPELISEFHSSNSPEGTERITTGIPQKKLTKESNLFNDVNFKPEYIESSKITGILQAIFFGLIAGFILNFMPCVLPVVSLKVMSFVKHAGEDRKVLTRLGLLFSLGIILSFAALASLAAFFGYSWGGLFQHEIFLVIMTSIVFILALSMFEIFTINAPSFAGKAAHERKNHYADAFMKGLLATLLATPCSGPFLGGTLAWALSQPPIIIFIIFISVGTGMALPYLLLTINPALMRFIPKPGEWMRTFENIMAFLLIFTVVYLLSILGSGSLLPMVTFLAFLALAFWQFGKFGSVIQTRTKRLISIILLVLITGAGYFVSFNYLYERENSAEINSGNFSQERLYRNRDEGRISLIKFTADWCPNCKLVEKMSLYTSDVSGAIRENNIDFMVADITQKNPAAEELMKKLGSRSIPFLAIVPSGERFKNPICLRDIYSEENVLKAIKMAGEDKSPEKGPGKFMFEINQ